MSRRIRTTSTWRVHSVSGSSSPWPRSNCYPMEEDGPLPTQRPPMTSGTTSCISMRPACARRRLTARFRRCASAYGNAEPAGSCANSGHNPQSAQSARGAERGGSCTPARGSARHQTQGSARCTYGAGLRVSKGAHLKVDDIDLTRMLIRVEQGKGRKDRNAMLSPQLLELCVCGGVCPTSAPMRQFGLNGEGRISGLPRSSKSILAIGQR